MMVAKGYIKTWEMLEKIKPGEEWECYATDHTKYGQWHSARIKMDDQLYIAFTHSGKTKYDEGETVELSPGFLNSYWRPYQKPVDFWVAWQAYMNSKKIYSKETGFTRYTTRTKESANDVLTFTQKEINGEWYILD